MLPSVPSSENSTIPQEKHTGSPQMKGQRERNISLCPSPCSPALRAAGGPGVFTILSKNTCYFLFRNKTTDAFCSGSVLHSTVELNYINGTNSTYHYITVLQYYITFAVKPRSEGVSWHTSSCEAHASAAVE